MSEQENKNLEKAKAEKPAEKKENFFVRAAKGMTKWFRELKSEAKKVIFGGLMMGVSMSGMQEVVMKNTNAILCMNEKDATPPKTTACIKCGRCINHCPLKLMPANIETAFNLNKPEELKALKVNLCMECGCCSFICPAKRPLVQTNKMAKAMLNKYNAEQKAAAEKAKAKEEAKEAAK